MFETAFFVFIYKSDTCFIIIIQYTDKYNVYSMLFSHHANLIRVMCNVHNVMTKKKIHDAKIHFDEL